MGATMTNAAGRIQLFRMAFESSFLVATH